MKALLGWLEEFPDLSGYQVHDWLLEAVPELRVSRRSVSTFVRGLRKISKSEFLLDFTPSEKWQRGHYQILLDGRFEDVAGNNLHNLLDQMDADGVKVDSSNKSIRLEIL